MALPMLVQGQHRRGVWDEAFAFALDSADVASGKSVFEITKPEVIVEVSKHRYGADMFSITAVNPNYPPDLLRLQAIRICEIVGTPARGLFAGTTSIRSDPRLNSTRATFATNGVIDRDKGILRISPIIQAFAGARPPYTVHGIMILFNGEQPTPNVLRSYRTPGLRLQAIAVQNPPVVEYRIQLLSQDPKLLEVPDSLPAEQEPLTASTLPSSGADWSLWIPLLAGAAAAGVLVYLLMLRATDRTHRK